MITSDNVDHFVGCASPTPGRTTVGVGWIRLRCNPALAFPPILVTDTVKSITIIFDEGQDGAPWNFGLAVLDNIDINGTLIGQGDNAGKKGDEKGKNRDTDDDDERQRTRRRLTKREEERPSSAAPPTSSACVRAWTFS